MSSIEQEKRTVAAMVAICGPKENKISCKACKALQLILAIDVTLSLLGEIFVIHLAISNVAVVSIGKYILESDIYSFEKLV